MRLVGVLLALLVSLEAFAAEPDVTPLYEPAMVLRTSNFRADPSTNQPPLDTFKAGKQVLILGETKDDRDRTWYAVSLYDGTQGFIFGKLLEPLPDFPKAPNGLGTTNIEDESVAQQLVGSHGTTLKWVGAQPWGELVVFEDLGLYYLKGRQQGEGKAANDVMEIEGFVTDIDSEGFTLNGTISYELHQYEKPVNCTRKGTHRFQRIADSNTWRASSVAKPCGKWEDELEIYLRKE